MLSSNVESVAEHDIDTPESGLHAAMHVDTRPSTRIFGKNIKYPRATKTVPIDYKFYNLWSLTGEIGQIAGCISAAIPRMQPGILSLSARTIVKVSTTRTPSHNELASIIPVCSLDSCHCINITV